MNRIKNPWSGLEGYNCYGCAPHNPLGLKMEFFEDGDYIVSVWKPSQDHQSWIDTLHGGIQSVLLDEICGWVVTRKLQTTGVTSKMETRFIKPVHTTDDHLTIKAHLVEMKRNIAIIEAELYDVNDQLCTKATCTFFTFPQDKARNEMHFHSCDTEE